MTKEAVDNLKAEMIKKTGMNDAQAHKLLRSLVVASQLSLRSEGRLTPDEVARAALKIENEIA